MIDTPTVREMPSRPSGAIWNAGRLESGTGCQAGFSARVSPQGIRPDSTRRQGNGRATGHPSGHPLPPSAPRSPHSRPGRAARAFADGRRIMCRQRTRTRHGTFLKFRRRCLKGRCPDCPISCNRDSNPVSHGAHRQVIRFSTLRGVALYGDSAAGHSIGKGVIGDLSGTGVRKKSGAGTPKV